MTRLRHTASLAGAVALLGLWHARAESDTAAFSIASGGRISTLTRPTFIRSAQRTMACILGKQVDRVVRVARGVAEEDCESRMRRSACVRARTHGRLAVFKYAV